MQAEALVDSGHAYWSFAARMFIKEHALSCR